MKTDELMILLDDGENLYDQKHLVILGKQLLINNDRTEGAFKAFTYKNSLRFSVIFFDSPCTETVEITANKLKKYISENEKDTYLLWYSQINNFSDSLLDRLGNYSDPYHFLYFRIKKDNINTNVDMKGLICRKCTRDMIDACIDVLEDVFTPFPDNPGSFRNDKERIISDFLDEHGGASLFFKDDQLVGICGHKDGHITETVIRKEFQGQGYGEVIVRSVLKSILELGYDAELTTGHYNKRAISLYQKVGFEKVYESKRVTLSRMV